MIYGRFVGIRDEFARRGLTDRDLDEFYGRNTAITLAMPFPT